MVDGSTLTYLPGRGFADDKLTEFGRISRISEENDCGFRLQSVNQRSNGKWILKAYKSNLVDYRSAVLSVNWLPKTEETLTCPTEQQDFCVLTNVKIAGKPRVDMPCNEWNTSLDDYTCTFAKKGRMEMSDVTKVSGKSEEKAKEIKLTTSEGVKYTDNHLLLECSVPQQVPGILKTCTIRHRTTGKMFQIKEGQQHSRYSTYLTNFADRLCQFELPSQVELHEEGLWIMEMTLDNRMKRVCRFTVGNRDLFVSRILEETKTVTVINTMNDMVNIKCSEKAPYPIKRCYLKSPYEPALEFNVRNEEKLIGNCDFYPPLLKTNTLASSIEWTFQCGFNGPNEGDPDFLKTFRVRTFKSEAIDGKYVAEQKSLECHQINKLPIESCMFLSPSGRLFSVPSDSFTSDVFEYYAPMSEKGGFAKGACGIKFKTNMEEGQWKCVISRGTPFPAETQEGLFVLNPSLGPNLISGRGR